VKHVDDGVSDVSRVRLADARTPLQQIDTGLDLLERELCSATIEGEAEASLAVVEVMAREASTRFNELLEDGDREVADLTQRRTDVAWALDQVETLMRASSREVEPVAA
jgi:hypothetical protein